MIAANRAFAAHSQGLRGAKPPLESAACEILSAIAIEQFRCVGFGNIAFTIEMLHEHPIQKRTGIAGVARRCEVALFSSCTGDDHATLCAVGISGDDID